MFDDIDFLAPHSTAARPRRKPAPPPDVGLVKPAAETPGRWERLPAHPRRPPSRAPPRSDIPCVSSLADAEDADGVPSCARRGVAPAGYRGDQHGSNTGGKTFSGAGTRAGGGGRAGRR